MGTASSMKSNVLFEQNFTIYDNVLYIGRYAEPKFALYIERYPVRHEILKFRNLCQHIPLKD